MICEAKSAFVTIDATQYDGKSVNNSPDFNTANGDLSSLTSSDYIYYDDVEFTSQPAAIVVSYSYESGYGDNLPITFRLDSPDGPVLATVKCKCSGSWHNPIETKAEVTVEVTGTHSIYYQNTNSIGNLASFYFIEGDESSARKNYNFIDLERYNDEIQIAAQLGILDLSSEIYYDPKLPVTRAEAANAIYRLCGTESVSGNSFEDVKRDHPYAAAVNYLRENNIAYGYAGKFYPDDMISSRDAVLLFERMLGFDKLLSVKGSSVEDYMELAAQAGLLSGIDINDVLRRETLARLVYNTLRSKSLNISEVSDSSVTYKNDELVIGERKVKRLVGIVEENSMTALRTPYTSIENGYVKIGGEEYLCGSTPAAEYIGYMCEVFYTESDGEKSIIAAVKSSRNKELISVKTLNGDFLDYIGYDKISAFADGKTKTVNLKNTLVIYNNKALDKDLFDSFDTEKFHGSVTVFSNTENDIMIIDAYENFRITNLSDKSFTNEFTGELIEVDPDSAKISIDGMKLPLNQCAFGDVGIMKRSVNSEDEKYTELIIVHKTVTGAAEKINEDKVTISGVEYPVAAECAKIELGEDVEFYLNAYGEIVYFKKSSVKADNIRFGILIGKSFSEDDDTVSVKLSVEGSAIQPYNLAESALLDGVKVKSAQAAMNGTGAFKGLSAVDNQSPVYFRLNESGEIAMLDTYLEGAGGSSDNLIRLCEPKSFYFWGDKIFENGFAVFGGNDKKVVRLWKTSGDPKVVYGAFPRLIPDSGTVYGAIYSSIGDEADGDIFIQTDVSSTYWRSLCVFDSLSYVYKNERESICINAYRGKDKLQYIVDPEICTEKSVLELMVKGLERGDCFKVDLSDEGLVSRIELNFLHGGKKATSTGQSAAVNAESQYSGDTRQEERYTYGEIESVYDDFFIMSHNDGTKEKIYANTKSKIITLDSDNKLRNDEVAGSLKSGDKVFVWITSASVRQIVKFE